MRKENYNRLMKMLNEVCQYHQMLKEKERKEKEEQKQKEPKKDKKEEKRKTLPCQDYVDKYGQYPPCGGYKEEEPEKEKEKDNKKKDNAKKPAKKVKRDALYYRGKMLYCKEKFDQCGLYGDEAEKCREHYRQMFKYYKQKYLECQQ